MVADSVTGDAYEDPFQSVRTPDRLGAVVVAEDPASDTANSFSVEICQRPELPTTGANVSWPTDRVTDVCAQPGAAAPQIPDVDAPTTFAAPADPEIAEALSSAFDESVAAALPGPETVAVLHGRSAPEGPVAIDTVPVAVGRVQSKPPAAMSPLRVVLDDEAVREAGAGLSDPPPTVKVWE